MPIPGSRQNKPGGSGRGYPRSSNPAPAIGSRSPFGEPNEELAPRVELPIKPPPAKAGVNSDSSGQFSGQEVRELVKLVHDNDITELLIERDGGAQRLLIKRDRPAPAPVMMAAPVAQAAPVAVRETAGSLSLSQAPAPGSVIPDPGAPPVDSFHKIVAPMVGTFYRKPDPKDAPFVSEGDMVEKDQVIGIIEAMKIMNEIKSEHRGRCIRVPVENGQPVEYGQTLLLLEPA